ncbi:MAG: plasmid partitioning protein RepB [Hyphomicrobiales bacterium]
MVKRKDKLKALFAGDVPDREPSAVSPPQKEIEPTRKASGAVRAMGLSLGQLADSVQGEAETIKIDPAKIEDGIVRDRLSDGAVGDDDFAALVASIRDHGQQVPILVRPHLDEKKRKSGFYQAAYGHRRLRAARELERHVDAIIREMDDDALVLAQGQENAARRNLSFVERAFFAKALIDQGFDRATAQAALGAHKSDMTRLLQVAERIPIRFARAVGPAPKAGRPRWLALGDLLSRAANIEKASDEISKPAFSEAASDVRFQMLFDRLSRPPKKKKSRVVKNIDGQVMAEQKGKTMTFSKEMPDAFTDYVAEELPRLLKAFEKTQVKR